MDETEPMKQVLNKLQKEGLDLSSFHALEMFAREGDWHTTVYENQVKSLDAWEIDPAFQEGLRRNLPQANVTIADSIQEMKKPAHEGKYDFIVVDTPMNRYGPNNEYCEHFDVVPAVCRLLANRGILIFNVNTKPYNFDRFDEWQKRREEYYGLEDTSNLSLKFLLDFYKGMFEQEGYTVEKAFSVPRGGYDNEGLHYLYNYYVVCVLSRKKKK